MLIRIGVFTEYSKYSPDTKTAFKAIISQCRSFSFFIKIASITFARLLQLVCFFLKNDCIIFRFYIGELGLCKYLSSLDN